jgi:diadenosine tetraphosphate (Ap4A) HIT family hydrolase
MTYSKIKLDTEAYIEGLLGDGESGRCFICELVEDPGERPIVYRDEVCIAFFNRYPRLLGYTLLAPVQHRTGVVDDFTEDEYLVLQQRVHRVGRAITQVIPTERLYVFSFGSHQGVSHVHWHLAPLPPGLHFREQQFEAVSGEEYFDIPLQDQLDLAARIGAAI